MEAVALGSLDDVRAALATGPDLEERDSWGRTAWLIAILGGDVARADLLRSAGADTDARGRCGQPPLSYAVESRRPEMLGWLLRAGADVDQVDDFNRTALIEAVEADDIECVQILLEAGADVGVIAIGTAIAASTNREIIVRLLDAGADPAELSDHGRRALAGLPAPDETALAAVRPKDFQQSCTRTFGRSNPERMDFPFWVAMTLAGVSAYAARRRFGRESDLAEPVWCAQRFGQSVTVLPDGRSVLIGGEHEDSYDADFCIYNDVIVVGPGGSVAIHGYPESVFPPTDFHTATLVDDHVYVIGSLGYQGTRRYGETPVCRLDVRALRMERVEASGQGPGWVYRHRAALVGQDRIRVWGGEVATGGESGESHAPNEGSFVLDLGRLEWHREPGGAG
jgi:hypothetical protein